MSDCHNKYCCTCCPKCYPNESDNISKQKIIEAIEKHKTYMYEGEYESSYPISKEDYENKDFGRNGYKFIVIDPDNLIMELKL